MMSKDEFMKLSKDEIFNMIQGQLAKRAVGTENTVKRQDKGTKYNVKLSNGNVKEKIKYHEDKARQTNPLLHTIRCLFL